MTDAGRSAARSVEAAVAAVRDNLTEGQRWTAALALSLAALLLFAGLPTAVTHLPGRPETAPARVRTAGEPAPGSGGSVAAPPAVQSGELPDAGAGAPVLMPGPRGSLAPGTSVPRSSTPAAVPPAVVALVREGDAPAGRDDATMAGAFLARAGFEATVLPIGASAEDTCADALASGTVVVLSTAVDTRLEQCLLDGGATVVGFGRSTTAPAPGMVSTRRELVASLVDLARWGIAGGALDGRVGLVAGVAERTRIDAAARQMRAAGVDVSEVAYVDDDPGSVTDGLRAFAAEGVDVVVLAAPMAVQRQWAAQQPILVPGLRTVVSDAFDAIVDESYPPSFDGALAHTSLRVPWYARTHGETVVQAGCRQTWEDAAQVMLASEAVRVFAWCQHVAMVGEALRSGVGDGEFRESLLTTAVDSPLTSLLDSLPDGGYGPVADAALVWRASCACWEPVRGFTRQR